MSDIEQLIDKDGKHLLHFYTNLRKRRGGAVDIITHGERVFIYDSTGRDYIDASSAMWAASLGFSERRPIEAAFEQAQKLPFYSYGLHKNFEANIELAEKIAGMVPINNARIHFATTGSEANDFLIKFIWYANNANGRPDKKKIISRNNSWHGATIASGSMSGIKRSQMGFDLPLDRFLHTDEPHYFRNALPGESEEEFTTRLAKNLEDMILQEGPETVAAFIAEPITGASGVVVPPASYYPKIQQVLKKYDVYFLADEVITGFGRTGNMFGCETCNIQPDTMTFAKGFSGAYFPISAFAINEEIDAGILKGSDDLGFFAHGSTFAGHPVSCAAALKVLEIYQEEDITGQVRKNGAYFEKKIRQYQDHPMVGEIRGTGLMWGLELVADKETKRSLKYTGASANQLAVNAEHEGLIIRNLANGDSIAFAPPLIINEQEIDEVFVRFDRAFQKTVDWICERGYHQQ